MATIFDFNGAEGWGEKEICTKGAVDSQKQGEGWGYGNKDYLLALPLPPNPTVHSNSKSNMSGQIN